MSKYEDEIARLIDERDDWQRLAEAWQSNAQRATRDAARWKSLYFAEIQGEVGRELAEMENRELVS